jgi:hypothetical protein
MIISLPNGKSIEISLEAYLRMTDEDFEYLMSLNWGEDIINPFESSVLLYGEYKEEEEIDEDSDSEEVDKLKDLDSENHDE